MGATTVKLDSVLLSEIAGTKPKNQTLSAYVREALRRDLRRQHLRKAAGIYNSLLREDPVERQLMDEWEAAPLSVEPKQRRS